MKGVLPTFTIFHKCVLFTNRSSWSNWFCKSRRLTLSASPWHSQKMRCFFMNPANTSFSSRNGRFLCFQHCWNLSQGLLLDVFDWGRGSHQWETSSYPSLFFPHCSGFWLLISISLPFLCPVRIDHCNCLYLYIVTRGCCIFASGLSAQNCVYC